MQKFHIDALSIPDLGYAPDWLYHVGNMFQPIRGTNQIWVVTFCSEISNSIAKYQLFSQATSNPDNSHLRPKKSSVLCFSHVFLFS